MTSRTLFLLGLAALAVPATWRAFAESEPNADRPFDVRPVAVRAEDRRAVLRGNTAFALDVSGRLGETPGNFVFSPLSLSTALVMTMDGAGGRTRRELASTLHLRLPPARLDRAFQGVLAGLAPSPGSELELRVANGLWMDRSLRLRGSFVSGLQRHFGARAASADFENDPEAARQDINRWGSDRTAGQIPTILPPGSLPRDAAFVIANAVYFAGKWEQPFEETRDDVFTTAHGGPILVPLMRHEGGYRWSASDGFQTVELPYKGGEYAMDVLVPDARDGLPAVEASLTPATLTAALDDLADTSVRLSFPSFAFATELSLRDTLESLGTKTAFDPRHADFSRITGSRPSGRIDAVLQNALIRVDEEGTVAAAVTIVIGGAGQAFEAPPRDVTVDRPFLFVVRHLATGAILFLGRVEDPTK